jgi:hypothetical protein
LPYGFEVNVKTILRQIAQIFVAFSEKLNFTNMYLRQKQKIKALRYIKIRVLFEYLKQRKKTSDIS